MRELIKTLKGKHRQRLGKQTNNMHILAWILNPLNAHRWVESEFVEQAINELKKHIPRQHFDHAIGTFIDYKKRRGRFSTGVFKG